jgi:hypothetical protein
LSYDKKSDVTAFYLCQKQKALSMKSIFDKATAEGLISRIQQLDSTQKAKWGKMTPSQMIRHCLLSEEMFLGKRNYERLFIGRIFGKMTLSGILKNDDPLKPNQPTHPTFKITGGGNFETDLARWLKLMKEYEQFSNTSFIHPFFGTMNKEQIGIYVYKHTDHHLRQFSA